MIRTGDEYRDSLRDGREIWIDGERVTPWSLSGRPGLNLVPMGSVRVGVARTRSQLSI